MSKEFLSQPPRLLSELMQQIDGNGGNLRTWPVGSGADSEELSWCRHPVTMSPRCWRYSYLTPEHRCFLLEELGRQWSGCPDAAAPNINIVGDSID